MFQNPEFSPQPVQWGGQSFSDPGALARWLRARGASPALWAIRHPQAAAGLGMPMPQGAPAAPPAQDHPGAFAGPGMAPPPQAGPMMPFPAGPPPAPGGMAGPGLPPPQAGPMEGPGMEPPGEMAGPPPAVLAALQQALAQREPRRPRKKRVGAQPRRLGGV